MAEKKEETPEGGPCPPVEDRGDDSELVNETAANYDIDETDEEGSEA